MGGRLGLEGFVGDFATLTNLYPVEAFLPESLLSVLSGSPLGRYSAKLRDVLEGFLVLL